MTNTTFIHLTTKIFQSLRIQARVLNKNRFVRAELTKPHQPKC